MILQRFYLLFRKKQFHLNHKIIFTASPQVPKTAIIINNQIIQAKDITQLQQTFKKYKGKFNNVNLTTFLRRISQMNTIVIQQKALFIQNLVSQIKKQWMLFKFPNQNNKRPLANLICYLSNLKEVSLNQNLKQINFQLLISFLNKKQFMMVICGLIKLNLHNNFKEGLEPILYKYINEDCQAGYIISIWRACILQNITNPQISKFLVKYISKKIDKLNLTDFVYLLFCLNRQKQNIKQIDTTKMLKRYPTQKTYKPLLNSIELTIAYQNLIQIEILSSDQVFMRILETEHLKNLKFSNSLLRNVANTINALSKLRKPTEKIALATKQQFQKILKNRANYKNIDNMSLVSLFFQLLQIHPQDQFLVKVVSDYLLQKKLKQFLNSQIQMLIYGYYLHKKALNHFIIQFQLGKMFIEEIIIREFQQKEIVSIINFATVLQWREARICKIIREKFIKIQRQNKGDEFKISERLSQKCFMSRMSTECLKCLEKP